MGVLCSNLNSVLKESFYCCSVAFIFLGLSLFLSFRFKHIFSRLFSDLQVLLTYPNINKIPGQKWSLLSFFVEMNWFQPLIFENNGELPQFHIRLLKCTDSFCLVKSGLGQHVRITYKSNPRILHRNSLSLSSN